jgi:hypothetical protein
VTVSDTSPLRVTYGSGRREYECNPSDKDCPKSRKSPPDPFVDVGPPLGSLATGFISMYAKIHTLILDNIRYLLTYLEPALVILTYEYDKGELMSNPHYSMGVEKQLG